MRSEEYINKKNEYSYNLHKNHKFFRKARAIVIKDKELLVIKVTYNDGRIHYLLPGGGVDDGETIKQAVVRETLEEYNDVVVASKYLGKQYYKVPMEYNGKKFISNRTDYFYICNYVSSAENISFGLDGEFQSPNKRYEKTSLTLSMLKKINHKDLNDMSETNFNKLLKYMESLS